MTLFGVSCIALVRRQASDAKPEPDPCSADSISTPTPNLPDPLMMQLTPTNVQPDNATESWTRQRWQTKDAASSEPEA